MGTTQIAGFSLLILGGLTMNFVLQPCQLLVVIPPLFVFDIILAQDGPWLIASASGI